MDDSARFCYSCGEQLPALVLAERKVPVKDTGSFWWFVLGFVIPVAGLVLWLVWKEERPETAKMNGLGALTALILTILGYAFLFILVIIGTIGSGSSESLISLSI